MRVAFLGTGSMGAPMVRNLVAAGHEVHAWNRTGERAEGLGAHVCATPAEAAPDAEVQVLVTMLADGAATEAAVEGALRDDLLWVQMATVGIEATERLAARHGDAPVLGTKVPAEKGQLTVIAAGPPESRARAEEVFRAVGSRTIWVSERPGDAQRLKLVVNNWVITIVGGVAEGIALAEKLGLDPQLFLDTLAGSQIDTPYLHLKGDAILRGDFEPSFSLRLALKDLDLVLEAAEGLPAAVTRTLRAQFERAVELGHGEEDQAAVYFAAVGP